MVQRETPPQGIRPLLAPLPGRMPNRGRWGGSFPVVAPPANLFRASGSGMPAYHKYLSSYSTIPRFNIATYSS